MEQQLYKVVSKYLKSQDGGDWDWSEYLPKKNGQPGKWLPKRDVSVCYTGWHVTPYPCMWMQDGSRVFEVETRGEQEQNEEIGVIDKYAVAQLRLLREVDIKLDDASNSGYRNSGDRNSGNYNSGDYNSGNYNSGDSNSGNYNSGDSNSGYRNSGDRNSGDSNSGYRNSGDRNSGNYNSGYYNSGDRNSGYRNSGNYNSGYYNSGDRNSGNYNSGNWNSCDYESGHLNTVTSDTIRVFNKPCLRSDWESALIPNFFYDVEGSKESWQKAWENVSDADKELLVKLPNFDATVWFDLTGIKLTDNDD